MSELPKSYDPKQAESKWYSFWEKGGFFRAGATSDKPPYCIVIPPPNVTGVLHMGHALDGTLQDILIRWKRMEGFEALWIPGTDHAGIATQTVVEKAILAQTGKRRQSFSREEFLSFIWDWKEKSQETILSQLKKLGCSCDWDRLAFTMDEKRSHAVRVAFKKMFDQGLIYRGDYLVNWDPVTQTALSDDEVEHEERKSFLWHIRYPLVGKQGSLVIATTRPETMLGDVAVAVHPKDPRYQSLIGEKVRLPLTNREIPVIADPFVEPEFGTGAVKITPAHDFNDFEMARRHDLPWINIMTPEGKINETGGRFEGLSMLEARSQIVKALKEQGMCEKEEPHLLRVGLSYRSKAVIEPYLSKQWFVKLSAFKKELLSAVQEKRVTLIPPHWESTYTHWIENLRDWCISRQIWWGHRIPIWYRGEEILCSDVAGVPPEVEKDPEGWVQDSDVLDTWFSSALWPLSTLGWPEKTPEFERFYPTSTLITGHDILFFWVARMILMGEHFEEKVPFHETFLHGLIYGKSYWKELKDGTLSYLSFQEKKEYDLGAPLPSNVFSKWEKMSKSKGNVVDPLAIIDEYGTDAMRLALAASATYARQIDLDLRRFEEFKNFANKVWNGARFVLMHLEDLSVEDLPSGIAPSLCTLEDRWILTTLDETAAEINHHFASYAFDKAAGRSYEFFWNELCSIYVESVKPTLFGKMGSPEIRKNKQKILLVLLTHALTLLHPITPFITEELFQLLKQKFPTLPPSQDPRLESALEKLRAPACIVAPYPKPLAAPDEAIKERFQVVLSIVRAIRNLRTEMGVPPGEKTPLFLFAPPETRELLIAMEEQDLISALAMTQNTHLRQEPSKQGGSLVGLLEISIPVSEALLAKEKLRLQKEETRLEGLCLQTKSKLENPEFREKAPKEVREKMEKALFETTEQLSSIRLKLYRT